MIKLNLYPKWRKMRKKAKCKILFIDHTPIAGGGQLCLASHLKYLNRDKFDPFLVISKNSQLEYLYKESLSPIYKIEFEALKRKSPQVFYRLIASVWEFRKLAKKIKPDIVVANTARALIVTALARVNYKLISYVREEDYPQWLMKVLDFRIDKHLMVSEFLNQHYKVRKTKTEVVYLGSDLKRQLKKITPDQVKQFRKTFGLNENDIVIGFVGRLVSGKGPHYLINAVSSIKDSNVKLIMFGTGKGQEGDIEEKLRKQVKKRGLESKIHFAGFVADRGLIYKTIDIFVLPTCRSEAFATSMIEAAFAKLPIIATKLGGTPEFIKDGYNGLLVSPGKSGDLKQALVRLIEDKKLAQKFGRQAYKDVQPFTEEKLAEKLEKIYENCLSA